MAREDRRAKREKEKRKKGGKRGEAAAQVELVSNVIDEVRTINSEIDLIKQRINLIIREINALKRVVLKEKQEIKELEVAQTKDDSRFESILGLLKGMRGGEQ